ncbi:MULTISPECIES: HEAT repeat domain-containing protein [Calothrix]|uniref:HEAT repeat domain-containing protein n=2 Tax=Calothrix TaxID=1186 RepID=A0ABR8A953_9CYAN|nr:MULTISPECIES: HEAT repeat domain-containing protein [Calothrix]MBD2196517.1 HEAT repeat domain-containing protein [Calothrix parietina FACHB-288]MBD2224588.1 HEAT repeat domain-containing protein [Calothrix anomala FACHB-343]
MSPADDTAEILYQQLQILSDRELQVEYLNSWKWTEAIALILPKVDDETALRVVKLALEVDLCLGAKLAGAVKPELQSTTVDLLLDTDVYPAFLFKLLGMTGTDAAISFLVNALNDDEDYAFLITPAIAEIGTEAAVLALTEIINDEQRYDYEISGTCVEAAQALGNINSESARQALMSWCLKYFDWSDFSSTAANILIPIATPEIVPELLKFVENEEYDDYVRADATMVLDAINAKASIATVPLNTSDEDEQQVNQSNSQLDLVTLEQLLQDEDESVRISTVKKLGEVGSEAVIQLLQQALNDEYVGVHRCAAEQLGSLGTESAVAGLIQALSDENSAVRWSAAEGLSKIGAESATTALIAALNDESAGVRSLVVEALGKIQTASAVLAVQQALSDADIWVRLNAAQALGKIGFEECIEILRQALSDRNFNIRSHAAFALGEISAKSAIPELIVALTDENSKVRTNTIAALGKIVAPESLSALLRMLEETQDYTELAAVMNTIYALQKFFGYYNPNYCTNS